MTHRSRYPALLLPLALLVSIPVATAGAQDMMDAMHMTSVRHAWRMGNQFTPRVEPSLEAVMSPDEKALHELLAAYETSLNAGDAGRIEQLYAEDGVFMPAGFPTASGRPAVRGAYDAVFKNIRIAIHFTVDELTVKGDFAYARTHSAGTSTVVATGASGPEANRELFVFARKGGAHGWKIARYLFNKAS
jgi:uncharacterized protein (TIGR02246 family)